VKEFTVVAKRFAFEPATLRVNTGDTVRVQITSADTDHGFSIAEFGVDETIPAGKTVTVEFVADKQGTFTTQCSLFCGTGHPDMQGTLIVE
jgi:cytochrome c oxidase subunit 2